MSEVVSSRVPKRGYKREIFSLLVALVLCAEVAAWLGAVDGGSEWIVFVLTGLVGLATITFALIRGGVSSLFGSRGREDGRMGPPAGQSVAVALAMSMGVVFYTNIAWFGGAFEAWSDIDELDPPSAVSALFSPSGQFWLFFNPPSLVCGIAIVLLFARMLHLSRVGLPQVSAKAVV